MLKYMGIMAACLLTNFPNIDASDVVINLFNSSEGDTNKLSPNIVSILHKIDSTIIASSQKASRDRSLYKPDSAQMDLPKNAGKTACRMEKVSLMNVDSIFQPGLSDQRYNKVLPVRWDGGNSGTLLDELIGVVYGFYPFWKINNTPTIINFSVYSRIGYYGFSFNTSGLLFHINDTLAHKSLLDTTLETSSAEFIEMAHKHGTKIDWVIAKDNWDAFTSIEKLDNCLTGLTSQIRLLLTPRITTWQELFGQIFSFGIYSPQKTADGVTLYVENFPDSTMMIDRFIEFFNNLRNEKKQINIMVSQEDLKTGRGLYNMINIKTLFNTVGDRTKIEPVKGFHSYLLVVMKKPYYTALQSLRLLVDSTKYFSDSSQKYPQDIYRQDIHRRIIPVVSPNPDSTKDTLNLERLRCNLLYCNDAFYHFGLSSINSYPDIRLPSININIDPKFDTTAFSPEGCIAQNFIEQGTSGKQKNIMMRLIAQNRIPLRIALVWNILLGGIFVLIVLRNKIYEIKGVRTIPVMVIFSLLLPMALFMILLLFDPGWKTLRTGNYPLISSLVTLIFSVVYIIWYRKSKQEIPSRAALREKVKIHPKDIIYETDRDS